MEVDKTRSVFTKCFEIVNRLSEMEQKLQQYHTPNKYLKSLEDGSRPLLSIMGTSRTFIEADWFEISNALSNLQGATISIRTSLSDVMSGSAYAEILELTGDVIYSISEALADIPWLDEQNDIGGMVATPGQLPAPTQFALRNGRLVVAQPSNQIEPERIGAAEVALKQLLRQAKRLAEDIDNSNLELRFRAEFNEFAQLLGEGGNPVAIGLAALSQKAVCEAYQAEIPDILGTQITALLIGVGMYVAQDRQWQAFSEQAALAEFTPQVARDAIATADAVEAALKQYPELADPEVPATIKLIREWIHDPRGASNRLVLGLVRTLENLATAAWEQFTSLLGAVAASARKQVAFVGGAIAAAAVLHAAAGLFHVPMPELGWMKMIPKAIEAGLSKIGD